MRILYSHRTRSADGQYVHIRELTDALKARGHEIIMAGPGGKREEKVKSLDAGDGVSLRSMLPGALYEAAELSYSLPAYRQLKRLCVETRPDVLYQRYNLFYYPGAWLKRSAKIPFILEVNAPLAEERATHGGLWLKALAKKSEREIWRAADMALPVTEALAQYLRAAGVSDEKICVVPNGVSAAFLSNPDGAHVRARYKLEGKLVLGFTGFVRDWHGLDRALRFLAQNKTENVRLLVVGDGPARAGLETLAAELGVADHVIFTGVVQHDAIPAHVAAFDVALQPAVVEYASPLKLFEYMALGKPVLAPDAPNIREILTHGENALLFGGADNGFDKALAALLNDDVLRARLGAAARETLLRRDLTWAGNARRIETAVEALLKARR